jgi:hypothetical protein
MPCQALSVNDASEAHAGSVFWAYVSGAAYFYFWVVQDVSCVGVASTSPLCMQSPWQASPQGTRSLSDQPLAVMPLTTASQVSHLHIPKLGDFSQIGPSALERYDGSSILNSPFCSAAMLETLRGEIGSSACVAGVQAEETESSEHCTHAKTLVSSAAMAVHPVTTVSAQLRTSHPDKKLRRTDSMAEFALLFAKIKRACDAQ